MFIMLFTYTACCKYIIYILNSVTIISDCLHCVTQAIQPSSSSLKIKVFLFFKTLVSIINSWHLHSRNPSYQRSSNICKNNHHKQHLIISDSLSALLAIEAPNPSYEIIYQVHNITNSSQKTMKFMWVPSHTGIPGNEKSDLLSNEAITSTSSSSIITLPYQDIKSINH